MLITGVVCATAPVLQWAFVHWLRFGYLGNAYATGLFNGLYVLLQVPHLFHLGHGYLFSPRQPLPPRRGSKTAPHTPAATSTGSGAAAFSRAGMREYLQLTAPGFVQTVAEWWVLEGVIFAASALRRSEARGVIAASAVVGNLQAVFIMAWIGFEVSAAVLVGRDDRATASSLSCTCRMYEV